MSRPLQAPHAEADPATIVDSARAIQSSLETSVLHVVSSRARFDTRISSEDANLNLPISKAEKSSLVDPASVTADVSAQLVCAIFWYLCHFVVSEHRLR